MLIAHEESATYKRAVVDQHTCDICGSDIQQRNYEVSDVTLQSEEGDAFPESGHKKVVEYDCCLKCFKGKVEPALQALGLKPRKWNVDY